MARPSSVRDRRQKEAARVGAEEKAAVVVDYGAAHDPVFFLSWAHGPRREGTPTHSPCSEGKARRRKRGGDHDCVSNPPGTRRRRTTTSLEDRGGARRPSRRRTTTRTAITHHRATQRRVEEHPHGPSSHAVFCFGAVPLLSVETGSRLPFHWNRLFRHG